MQTKKKKKSPINLVEKILEDPKASKDLGLYRCVQCGMCTSVCPAAKRSDYNPRDMIIKVLNNDESIITDDNLWKCYYCYTCHSICPVGNSPSEVNQILKQLAFKQGYGIERLVPFVGYGITYFEKAIGGIPDNFTPNLKRDFGPKWWNFKQNLLELREELGLGSLEAPKETIDEVNILLKNSGFQNRLKKILKEKEKMDNEEGL